MKRYLRPLGLLSGAAACDGLALPLAGGPLGFSLVEVIERVALGDIRRHVVPVRDVAGELTRHTSSRSVAGPTVMGIVNATPDSFSDGGAHFDAGSAIAHAMAMIQAGVGIVDIGGESTRPGATPVQVDEEIRRVVPVIAGIRAAGVTISVDTRNARTMQGSSLKL